MLKLVPPRKGKSTNFTIRGTHLGVGIDRSARTGDRRLAARVLAKIRSDIEEGTFVRPGAPTFAGAAITYMKSGGDGRRRFMAPILTHLGDIRLDQITQQTIDHAAVELYPDATPATRNRQVYAPISAVLRHAGVMIGLRRPKGFRGQRRTSYLMPEQAFALIAAAEEQSPEFAALLTFLLYTGCRLSEALKLTCEDVNLSECTAYIRQTKTEGARTAVLNDVTVASLANLPLGMDRPGERVFGLRYGGVIYRALDKAAAAAGVVIPERVAFHIMRHTWATWMRKYAGMDTAGLVETGAWRSRGSASIYEHLSATDEARKVSMLPVWRKA